MEKIKYKKYSKSEMLNIIKKMPILFVDTSLGDDYIIRQKDLADFIILETERTGHHIDMAFYIPGVDEPVATTFGWFLNTINPLLREEIIQRLVSLQTGEKHPKKIKIFNNNIFSNFSAKQMGITNGEVNNFDKFYEKYVRAKNTYNIKMKGA